jgi:tRNA threonylcarbamoyl adenosine modification protein YjeE
VRTCSEDELTGFAAELVAEARARRGAGRPRFVLEGPLGAGKSTLARAILEAFGIRREAEGSPTFALAHEYRSAEGWPVVHADGYRLRSEAELEATGLLEVLWDPERVVLFEWLDLFPETARALFAARLPVVRIRLRMREDDPKRREIELVRTGF